MAIYKLFPTKDATIYSAYPDKNTGLDEILDASCLIDIANIPQTSRFLIQFSQEEIIDVLTNKISGSTWSASLQTFVANIEGLNTDTIIDVFPISGSWDMGTGRYLYQPKYTDGVSWYWQDYSGSALWPTSSFNPNVTASWTSTAPGGGVWYTNSFASQTLAYKLPKDLNLDVTNIVTKWYTSSISNNGFIIKQREEWGSNENYQPSLKYFSVDTHTIYPPDLEFRWRDFLWVTGSSSIIDTTEMVATIEQNPGIFYPGSINKFRIYTRPEYPARVFQTASLYTTNYYLPSSSYYALVDLETNETIIDFDNQFTQISADTTSNYFTIWMDGLEPERQYQILIKTIIGGETLILDNNYYFKVVNQ